MLQESLKKQQEVCNRKEQALRQMKMVLKFREDALRKIEKAQKEKMELSQDDKDDVIVSDTFRSGFLLLVVVSDVYLNSQTSTVSIVCQYYKCISCLSIRVATNQKWFLDSGIFRVFH